MGHRGIVKDSCPGIFIKAPQGSIIVIIIISVSGLIIIAWIMRYIIMEMPPGFIHILIKHYYEGGIEIVPGEIKWQRGTKHPAPVFKIYEFMIPHIIITFNVRQVVITNHAYIIVIGSP